jgi:hypothetical protein
MCTGAEFSRQAAAAVTGRFPSPAKDAALRNRVGGAVHIAVVRLTDRISDARLLNERFLGESGKLMAEWLALPKHRPEESVLKPKELPGEHSLTSRQADQLRTDVATVECGLEVHHGAALEADD